MANSGDSSINYFPRPLYNHNDPSLWWDLMEIWFVRSNIVDEQEKFHTILLLLPPGVAEMFRDFTNNPPAEKPYTALKEAFFQRTGPTERQRFNLLFRQTPLGDQTPSQLLRRLQLAEHSGLDSKFLREAFLEKLPPNVQAILAVGTENNTLPQLAALADKIMETMATQLPSPSMAAVSQPPAHQPYTSSENALLTSLIEEVRALRLECANLRSQVHNRSRSSNRQGRSRSRQQICHYHKRFGKEARKCREPCLFSENIQAKK